MKKLLVLFVAGTLITLTSCMDPESESVNNNTNNNTTTTTNNNNDNDPPDFMEYPAILSSVTDGDTVYVWYNNVKYKVRFLGVNTPETYGTVEPFGPEAKQFTIDHLPVGSWVGLEFDDDNCATQTPIPDSCFDMYDRLLAYIRTEDDDDLGALLIVNGLGEVYTIADFNRKTQYLQLQNTAIANGVGIWSK
ncbi:MAG: thermonuclease family protein [Deltaproteobacteria bacterium]|nr:thermonuclease family protein [Deltaproteobacteria bacterium]